MLVTLKISKDLLDLAKDIFRKLQKTSKLPKINIIRVTLKLISCI